jgi:RecJ-like exonuclease
LFRKLRSDSLFLEQISRVATILRSLIRQKHPKIISHTDADGVCSAAIIARMLLREEVNFEIRPLRQLTQRDVEEVHLTDDDLLILTDMGSGQLPTLKEIMAQTHILIVDHHQPQLCEHPNLFHLNPLVFGAEDIPTSLVCYQLAKAVNLHNVDLIDLAIVGAVGDRWDRWEVDSLAGRILTEAVTLGRVSVVQGLRLYGRNSRPLHKALELSFNPYIPGISGSESQAVQLISELDIPLKEDGRWRRLRDLSLEEQRRLASAIILERLSLPTLDASDIFGDIYLLTHRPEEIEDAREFATLLNACARMGDYATAMGLCLDGPGALEVAQHMLSEYRKVISRCLEWIREADQALIVTDRATFIWGGNRIPDSLIGAITSIALSSNLVDMTKPVFGLADMGDGYLKVSARVSHELPDVNLGRLLARVARQMGVEGGGHQFAAGGLIPANRRDEFVTLINRELGELNAGKG